MKFLGLHSKDLLNQKFCHLGFSQGIPRCFEKVILVQMLQLENHPSGRPLAVVKPDQTSEAPQGGKEREASGPPDSHRVLQLLPSLLPKPPDPSSISTSSPIAGTSQFAS